MAKKTIEKVVAIRLYSEISTDKKIVKILSQLPGNVSVQQFVKTAILEYYGSHLKNTGEFSASLSESSVKKLLNENVASREAVMDVQKSLADIAEKEGIIERSLSELRIAILNQGARPVQQAYIPQMIPAQMAMTPDMYAMANGQYSQGAMPQQPGSQPPTQQSVQNPVSDEVQPLANPSVDVLGFLKDIGV